MQSLLSKTLLIGVALGICVAANAGTRVEEVWVCTLNEGKTLEEVHAANGAWLRFVNAKVAGGEIHSYVATSIVGDAIPRFVFVDSFPNMEAWIAAKAALETDKGQAIEAAINEVTTCSSNTLYSTTETESK